jgi:uncharacterized membrane protein YfcA
LSSLFAAATTDRILFVIAFLFTLFVVGLVLVLGYKRSKDRDEAFPNRQLIALTVALITLGSAVALAIPGLLSRELVSAIFGAAITGAVVTIASDRRGMHWEDPKAQKPPSSPNDRASGHEDPAG